MLRKISKIGATRCQILRLKCTKFAFRCGSAPNPAGELTALPQTRPIAVFKGPTSNFLREGKVTGRGGEGRDLAHRKKFGVAVAPPKA